MIFVGLERLVFMRFFRNDLEGVYLWVRMMSIEFNRGVVVIKKVFFLMLDKVIFVIVFVGWE